MGTSSQIETKAKEKFKNEIIKFYVIKIIYIQSVTVIIFFV